MLIFKAFGLQIRKNWDVSALARRMGISQSLMAQYISGKKNASKARMALILDTIHAVGRELAAV